MTFMEEMGPLCRKVEAIADLLDKAIADNEAHDAHNWVMVILKVHKRCQPGELDTLLERVPAMGQRFCDAVEDDRASDAWHWADILSTIASWDVPYE